MDTRNCKNCIRYRQHYIIDGQRCTPINCGHCTYPRLKHREPAHKACEHFEYHTLPPDLPDREAVINFLTQELLQFILSFTMPPNITDTPEK